MLGARESTLPMSHNPPDLTNPAIRLAAMGLLGTVTDELSQALAALARARVLLVDLSRWAGAVG
jgi:hypothetical protein